MAKLSDYDKKLLVADFLTGKYSQRELAKKHNISLGSVNKLTKDVEPVNEHLVNAQISILSAKAILPIEQLNAIMNTAQEEIYNKNLITNATQLNLARTIKYLSNNKKLEKVATGKGFETLTEVGLGASDFKQCQDAIDKASITLGVNQRHSNTVINNANLQENENKTIQIVVE